MTIRMPRLERLEVKVASVDQSVARHLGKIRIRFFFIILAADRASRVCIMMYVWEGMKRVGKSW